MTSESTVKLLSPEEIVARNADEAAQITFPSLAWCFKERGTRFRQWSADHPLHDFLLLMAELAEAQQAVLDRPRAVALPGQELLGDCARQGVPPLSLDRWPLQAGWRDDLAELIRAMKQEGTSSVVQDALERLQHARDGELDQQAQRLLGGISLGVDLATAPFIAAALQVYFVRLVAGTQSAFPDLAFGRIDDARICPCCGSHPVASVSRMGGDESGARYLHCAMCQTQWHMVRIQCAHCLGNRNVFYQELESEPGQALPALLQTRGAVRAEVCDDCNHYLKIVSMDKDPHVDPLADDLATLALDLLMAETGKARHGVNFLLLMGEPDDAAHSAEGP